jgi:hydroxymethylpyrimidine/phosphomethylpyrimidine kinase
MTPPHPSAPFQPIVVGALYPAVERGLAADLAAARALGGLAHPVCTLLLMAGGGTVTDSTDVPEDTVRSQLEHLAAVAHPSGMKIGALSSHGAANAVLDFAEGFDRPVVLDLQLSGPSGETVLTSRAIDAVMERLAVPDLVIVSRTDAEPLSGGEIHSLDDAQVAAQRLARRGARSVVVKCGPLPARFFETEPGSPEGSARPGGDGASEGGPFNADLFFNGDTFALFEAPHLPEGHRDGVSSAFALVALRALAEGESVEAALQQAKRFVTEALRASTERGTLDYHWESHGTP